MTTMKTTLAFLLLPLLAGCQLGLVIERRAYPEGIDLKADAEGIVDESDLSGATRLGGALRVVVKNAGLYSDDQNRYALEGEDELWVTLEEREFWFAFPFLVQDLSNDELVRVRARERFKFLLRPALETLLTDSDAPGRWDPEAIESFANSCLFRVAGRIFRSVDLWYRPEEVVDSYAVCVATLPESGPDFSEFWQEPGLYETTAADVGAFGAFIDYGGHLSLARLPDEASTVTLYQGMYLALRRMDDTSFDALAEPLFREYESAIRESAARNVFKVLMDWWIEDSSREGSFRYLNKDFVRAQNDLYHRIENALEFDVLNVQFERISLSEGAVQGVTAPLGASAPARLADPTVFRTYASYPYRVNLTNLYDEIFPDYSSEAQASTNQEENQPAVDLPVRTIETLRTFVRVDPALLGAWNEKVSQADFAGLAIAGSVSVSASDVAPRIDMTIPPQFRRAMEEQQSEGPNPLSVRRVSEIQTADEIARNHVSEFAENFEGSELEAALREKIYAGLTKSLIESLDRASGAASITMTDAAGAHVAEGLVMQSAKQIAEVAFTVATGDGSFVRVTWTLKSAEDGSSLTLRQLTSNEGVIWPYAQALSVRVQPDRYGVVEGVRDPSQLAGVYGYLWSLGESGVIPMLETTVYSESDGWMKNGLMKLVGDLSGGRVEQDDGRNDNTTAESVQFRFLSERPIGGINFREANVVIPVEERNQYFKVTEFAFDPWNPNTQAYVSVTLSREARRILEQSDQVSISPQAGIELTGSIRDVARSEDSPDADAFRHYKLTVKVPVTINFVPAMSAYAGRNRWRLEDSKIE
ncbi:MAG: hypothetical protein NUW37_16595 [Planctomycetes bacterium]|nr:hypothetical protein [Planctomycetota bacterium]